MVHVSKLIAGSIITFNELSPLEQSLVEKAERVRLNAQASYSNFQVGAAVLSQDNTVHVGCNVERCTYSQTTHAEQNAIDTMISERGPVKLEAIAIVAADKSKKINLFEKSGSLNEHTFSDLSLPCAYCLQIIWENCFGDPAVKIIHYNSDNSFSYVSIGEVLPVRFSPQALSLKI